MLPAFRKELSDLRQQEIASDAALPAVSVSRRRIRARIAGAAATALHRIADRLDPACDLTVDTRTIVGRQP